MPFKSATTIDDVLMELDATIARTRAAGSRLGYFACLYRSVTARVKDGIAAGRFQDGARMERLDVIFANRYLEALHRFQGGDRPTRSWSVAFQAVETESLIILQHLLLGMNAHINLDLGIAAAQTSPGKDLAGLEHDFIEINRLLGEMVDDIQDRIATVSPWMHVVDWATGDLDARFGNLGLQTTRDLAWRSAGVLGRSPAERMALEIDLLDAAVELMARRIAQPSLYTRSILKVVRLRERAAVAEVIDAMAGPKKP